MLTRRYLRIKVLQELYAFSRNNDANYSNAEGKLITNIEKIYELYIHQLSYLVELTEFESDRQDEAKKKYYPTEEDLNPNRKFVENKVLLQISDNKEYKRLRDKHRVNWADNKDMLRNTLMQIKASNAYKRYIASEEHSFEEDKKFLAYIVEDVIAYDELLITYFEDKNVNWVNDFDASLVLLEKTFRNLKPSNDEFEKLPSLYNSATTATGKILDQEFVKKLFRSAIFNADEVDEMINTRTEKWDFERIAIIDILILRMAVTEFLHFQTIPVKVTINEYIELSKVFSTPKSSVFVNGLLDKLRKEFEQENKINKIGRGLINE